MHVVYDLGLARTLSPPSTSGMSELIISQWPPERGDNSLQSEAEKRHCNFPNQSDYRLRECGYSTIVF